MKKILIFVGTRPEAIKMAPVYKALKSGPYNVLLVTTGQHKEMLEQALSDFTLKPDLSLSVMRQNQTLSKLSSKLFSEIDTLLEEEEPDLILVQGDTTTVHVATLCAFYRNIKVGHIEAGLRSFNLKEPFPEELNRRIVSLASDWHFVPTKLAFDNLVNEGINSNKVIITGNTVIDSLIWTYKEVQKNIPTLPENIKSAIDSGEKIILVTGHRRENFGENFENICQALLNIANEFPNVSIIYPVHLNPNVRVQVRKRLGNVPNIILEEPLSYKPFVYLMSSCYIILTDSGGIQEEGPSLGKPVLIMREVTERPEGIDQGVNMLVGTNTNNIYSNVCRLLGSKDEYNKMVKRKNPYGDGTAALKIKNFLSKNFI